MFKCATTCLVLLAAAAQVSAAPAGTYHGTKSVLGVHVDATITIDSSSAFDLAITGPLTLNCKNEAYTLNGDKIDVTNAGASGDCIHDALSSNHASLKSVDYDDSKDKITVEVKVTLITVKIELDHQASTALRGARVIATE